MIAEGRIKKRVWFLCGCFAAATTLGMLVWLKQKDSEKKRERRLRKQQNSVNIGAVMGMDVGGSLAKVVYFERGKIGQSRGGDADSESNTPPNESSLHVLATVNEGEGDTVTATGGAGGGMTAPSLPRANSSQSLRELDKPDHQIALKEFYEVMEQTRANANNDSALTHDIGMSFYSSQLQGHLHFFHFETRNMVNAIDTLANTTNVANNIRAIGCTGGGAHKFAKIVDEELDIKFDQMDELGCLVRGMHFALTNIEDECYTYRRHEPSRVSLSLLPMPSNIISSIPAKPLLRRDRSQSMGSTGGQDKDKEKEKEEELAASIGNKDREKDLGTADLDQAIGKDGDTETDSAWQKDVKEYTRRVQIPHSIFSSRNKDTVFPYLVVNIGSGVSILKINGPGNYERVSGSSVGGGTYWGLCRLLLKNSNKSYEDLLNLAESGDASEVDMLVRDIYGSSYDNGSLQGSMVASSFGKLTMKDEPREGVREEDLAIALLMMITNNIGQVAYLNAKLHSCSKIFFVGNFLRHNQVSCRRLAFAIDFWSKGTQEALFLHHEGYFGALGTFLQSAFGEDVDTALNTFGEDVPDARDAFIKAKKDALVTSRGRAKSAGLVDLYKPKTDI